jgi:methionyl-tRNA formyltransferase
VEIGPSETASDLFVRLAEAGAPLMVETLAGLADGSLQPRAQNHEGATYAPILDREDGRMDFAGSSAGELYNRWRGFQPWPGAFTTLDGKKLIVHRMVIAARNGLAAVRDAGAASADPGAVHVEQHRFFVACAGDTWLEFMELQLEGKKRMTAVELLRGMQIPDGARLGSGAQ